ncbi:hypothetical protein V8C40DRAFT_273884 [Trichoderma camerunense]
MQSSVIATKAVTWRRSPCALDRGPGPQPWSMRTSIPDGELCATKGGLVSSQYMQTLEGRGTELGLKTRDDRNFMGPTDPGLSCPEITCSSLCNSLIRIAVQLWHMHNTCMTGTLAVSMCVLECPAGKTG